MKVFFLIIPVCLLFTGHLFGRIRNGYETEIDSAMSSLQRLNVLLAANKDMLPLERRRLGSEADALVSYILHYRLTEALLDQLRAISPATYDEMDNITDRRGRSTDIYVRLIEPEDATIPFRAVSFFSQASVDEDAHHSKYGDHSVSIDIWVVHNALLLLCHELGHVKYIIPNLATYSPFYRRHYGRLKEFSYMGHHPADQSGKSADAFVKRYLRDRMRYRREGGDRPESVVSLMRNFRRDDRELQARHSQETIARSPARDRPRAGSRTTEE